MPAKRHPSKNASAEAVEWARATVRDIAAALEAGRAPRGAKALREAARRFREAGEPDEASRALRLLAQLEWRRGGGTKALAPARAAVRLARRFAADGEVTASLGYLARLQSALGRHVEALRAAEERLRAARQQGKPEEIAEALLDLAEVSWAAGARGRAFDLVEEAGALPAEGAARRAERLFAVLLLQAGCVAPAERRLSRLLRRGRGGLPPEEELPLRLARGWALLCLGAPERAARDFRRAARLAREQEHRLEPVALAALAVAEARRIGRMPAAARPRLEERVRRLVERARRRIRRLRDPEQVRAAEALLAARERAEPSPAPAPRDAARALVELARGTESLEFVAAARAEVERLAGLDPGAPAYDCALPAPLPLLPAEA